MVQIRNAEVKDLPAMLEIYNYAVRNLTATFDLEEQSMDDRMIWFEKYNDHYPLIIAEIDGNIIGYCCLNPYGTKPAFSRTAELSIYISPGQQGKGVGSALLKEIIRLASQQNFHTVLGVITAGNESSTRLHEKFGFVQVGCLKEVGYKFDQWHDVDFYQLII